MVNGFMKFIQKNKIVWSKIFFCLLLFKPHFLKAFVVGAEKNNLNEMVLTFFVLIYLFIYLSIYSHSCICSHFFNSCASCSYAL